MYSVLQQGKLCPLCRTEITWHTTEDAIIRQPTFLPDFQAEADTQQLAQDPTSRTTSRRRVLAYVRIVLALCVMVAIFVGMAQSGVGEAKPPLGNGTGVSAQASSAVGETGPSGKAGASSAYEDAETGALSTYEDRATCKAHDDVATCTSLAMFDGAWLNGQYQEADKVFAYTHDLVFAAPRDSGRVLEQAQFWSGRAAACGCAAGHGTHKKIREIRVRTNSLIDHIELVYANGETAVPPHQGGARTGGPGRPRSRSLNGYYPETLDSKTESLSV